MLTDVTIPESTLPGLGEAVSIPIVTWIVFLLALLGITIYGGIIIYHWFKYDFDSPMIWPTIILYLSVSILLIFIAFFAAVSIT